MLLRIIIILILLIIGHSMFAQTRPEADTVPVVSEKKSIEYVGIQVNQLLRQILNFGGNTTNTNPYILVYSINDKKSGVGFSTGLGYNYNESRTNDGFTSVISKNTEFSIRAGLEGKKYISRKFLTSVSADVLYETTKVATESTNGGGVPIKVETRNGKVGFGPRVTLNYQFHDRLFVGTEASYYFRFIKQEQTSSNSGMPNIQPARLKSYSFTLPTAIFLIMTF